MDSLNYTTFANRHKRFIQPEINETAGVKVNDVVEYNNRRWMVATTQALGSTNGVTLVEIDTGLISKVFGRDNLKKINKV